MSADAIDVIAGSGVLPARQRVRAAAFLEAERERFFLWAPVCLGLGIAAYFALPVEPGIVAAFVPLALVLILRFAAVGGNLGAVALTALILAGAGFAEAKLRVEAVRAPVLSKRMHNVEVTGVVTDVESKYPKGQRLTISEPHIPGLAAGKTPARVRIRTMSSRSDAAPGDRVRLKATLSPPAKPALPGGFDFARTAWFDQIGGVGYAYAAPIIEGKAEEGTLTERYRRAVEHIRQVIASRVRAALPGETGEIALALMTGERGGISAETNNAFKNSGLFHILSISGLHMVIMAGTVFYCVRLLMAAIPLFALTLPVKKIAAAAGIVSAFGYLAISGGAFATVRSALMIVIIFGAVLIDRPALALRNVALAALLILAIYPESLLDAGFQMSFAAVTALIASHEFVSRLLRSDSRPNPVVQTLKFFGEIISSTLIASAAVAPFAAYDFHQSQQYAVLANMIAIPICNVLVMPAALAAFVLMPFGLEAVALKPMGWGIEAMTWCADAVGSLPGAVGHIPQIPTLAFALMIAGGLWLMLWQTRVRLLGLALVVLGVFAGPWVRRPDVLVAQKGELVAVRDDSGKLSALRARGSKYDLERWLEYDGDGRSASEAQRGRAFTCDASGCIAHVNGALVAVARHPAAIADDCGNADVLVLDMPKPKDCTVPVTVIGVFDRWRNGAYALYIDKGEQSPVPSVRVETVAEHRGERPWSVTPPKWKPKFKPKTAQMNGDTAQTLSTKSTPAERQKTNSAKRSDPPAPSYEDPGEKPPTAEAATDDRAAQ